MKIALQEARRLSEQRRAAEVLEQRVAERTRQLTTVNEALRREITVRQRSEHRLATQYAITRVLAESAGVAVAMPHLLQAIGESMAWEWGAFWNVDRRAGVLRCASIWYTPHLEAAELDAISREVVGIPGPGLKGRVWQSAEPTWIADVSQARNFRRAPTAARLGLRGAIAFPILLRGQTNGIMEFFSRAISPPDEAQLAMLSAMGNQIGQFVERKRAEEKLRRSEAYLAEGQRISHTGSWAVKLPSEDVFWSPEVYRIYGLDPATTKLSQQMAFHLIHLDDRPCVQAAFARALREHSEYAVEHRAILPDGSIKHLHVLGHPVVNESGTLTEYVGTVMDITERKRAEELLRRAHERVEMILDSITDQFFAFDSDWRFTYVNKHAAEQMQVLGKDPARLIGKVLWEEFPDMPNEAAVRRVMSERVAISDELYYAPLGEWVENHMYPSPDGGLVTFKKYVTARKRAEEELRRSEERFRLLVEGVRDYAIFALDQTGHITSWNAGAEHIKGYRSEEVIGRHFSCLYPPEDLAVGKPEMELRVAAAEGRFEDEGWRLRKDGSRFWANVVITALHDPQGKLVGFAKITRDLTERKQAEENLAANERGLRLVADAIPHLVWSCLPDGTMDYCNQRWVAYTGLTVADTQDYGWTNSLHPDDVEPAVKAWQEAKARGTPYEVEQRVRGVDGRYRRFLSRAVPLYDEQGQLLQWFGTYTEIEARKQAEDALQQAQSELAHVTRVMTMGELTASIAHEVNQPLTAVINNSNACLRWLTRQHPDLEGVRGALTDIIANGQRASDVIAGIRAALKKAPTQTERLEINHLIEEVIGLTDHEVQRYEVQLRTELASGLPAVSGDHVQLQQVLLNLVVNGIEAMNPVTGRARQLLIQSSRVGPAGVLVAVQDSGIGLDQHTLERIFEPFYTTKAEGMGMGLSICRTIIEAYGGRLWAECNPGPGATLQFILPSATANRDD